MLVLMKVSEQVIELMRERITAVDAQIAAQRALRIQTTKVNIMNTPTAMSTGTAP